ncbi:unnamed protein product [Effrenium voratum]|nr:unnamed protein product [Effrenium voratum]
MLRPYGPGPVHRVPRPALRGRRIAQLPSWKEFREGTQDQRLKYKRISLKDGSIAHELHRAEAKDWRIAVVPAGHVVAGTGEEALWQLRPPPALRALYSTGVIKQEEYLNILRSMTGPTRKAELEASAPSQALRIAIVSKGSGVLNVMVTLRFVRAAVQELLQFLRTPGTSEPALLAAIDSLLQLQGSTKDVALALGVLGQRRQWQHAVQLLQDLLKSGGLRPDVFCCNSACGAASRNTAWHVALELAARGTDWANVACSAYEKGSGWRAALACLAKAGSAEALARNAVMTAGANAGEWQLSILLQDMAMSEVEPTTVSFTAAATMLGEAHWQRSLRLGPARPDPAFANAAVAALGAAWRRALAVGLGFSHAGLRLNLISHNTVTHDLAVASAWRAAAWHLARLPRRRLQPDAISFNSAITAAEGGQQWTVAVVLLEDALTTTSPSAVTYNSVTSAVGAGQQWQLAPELFHQHRAALGNDPLGLATLLKSCQESMGWSKAADLLLEAQQHRMTTTTSSKNAAAMACKQRWLPALAALATAGARCDEITFAAAAGACQEMSQWQHVLALHEAAQCEGTAPGLLLENAVHSAWRQARNWRGSLQLLREMQEDRILPDVVSFEATVQTCELRGQPGPAASVLNLCNSRPWLRLSLGAMPWEQWLCSCWVLGAQLWGCYEGLVPREGHQTARLELGPRLDVQASSKTMPKGWELEEHKVLRTYAVRGNEKQGTGRFQLYEDAKKRGYGGRSEGAQLRRRNAIRFFEKINEKFQDWGLEIRRQNKEHGPQGLARGWPPSVVFFAGDLRLRKMLLDCKKPPCPLPDTKLWIKVPGPLAEMDPTLEALQRAAGFLCSGEVAEVCNQEEKKDEKCLFQGESGLVCHAAQPGTLQQGPDKGQASGSASANGWEGRRALQSHQKDAALGKVAKGLQGDLQSAASGYREAMKGASSGTAYAPDSPILSQVVGPRPRPETHVQPATVSEPKELSLAELKDLPTKDLQAMLKQRGVTHNASDKDSLANWVHQHQHLPHVKVEAARSLQQLQQLPVAELRDMLQERGVEEGSATEKAELARWVWQHQHLPILHEMDPRRQRKTGGFGYGRRGREPEPEQKEEEKLQLEAEEVGKLEGESPKLLEGETSAPARRWPWVLAASAAAVVLLVGGIAANDLRQGEESAICRWW